MAKKPISSTNPIKASIVYFLKWHLKAAKITCVQADSQHYYARVFKHGEGKKYLLMGEYRLDRGNLSLTEQIAALTKL